MSCLLVVGAGGHGRAVAEAALLSGEWECVVFADDRWPALQMQDGIPVLGSLNSLESLASHVSGAIAAVGNNFLRQDWQKQIEAAGIPLVSVIHPRAWVSPSAVIGSGTAIMAMAMVGTQAQVGAGVIVNAGSVVDHDVCLEDFVHLGVGVSLAGGVHVGRGGWLQAGCCAGYGVRVSAEWVGEPGAVLMAKD